MIEKKKYWSGIDGVFVRIYVWWFFFIVVYLKDFFGVVNSL